MTLRCLRPFSRSLNFPPNFHLGVGSGTHAIQTAKIMVAFEDVCMQERPDWVVVVGDVNSTLACSIVAKKLLIKVAHVEAGLRSFDLAMPEEINRMVTDAITDCFFTTEESTLQNLLREGKRPEQIHFVGNVMIDNLFHQVEKLKGDATERFSTFELKKAKTLFIFLTLHRPSNVDNRDTLAGVAEALNEISRERPILFPVHPRTKKMLEQFCLALSDNIYLLPPLGFQESLFLWQDAELVLTDSGGLHEETTALGVPCLTLRENTERPITIEMGTNSLAGTRRESILNAYRSAKAGGHKKSLPPYWDGMAAERIWKVLTNSQG